MEFSVESMILSVERRPELWDTSCELYKDRSKKREGWTEVCCEVFEGFEDKDKADQLTIEKAVITKWRTVRDGYVKGRKKQEDGFRNGKSAKRTHPYIYAERLHFLDQVIQMRKPEETQGASEIEQRNNSAEVSNDNSEHQRKRNPDNQQQRVPREKRARKQPASQEKSNTDTQFEEYLVCEPELMSGREALEDDDHFSFFKSLLPTVRQLNCSQLLEFRIQTMQNLQRILFNKPPPSQSPHSSATFHPRAHPYPRATHNSHPPATSFHNAHFSPPPPPQPHQRTVPEQFQKILQDETKVSRWLSPNSVSTDSESAYADEEDIDDIINL